MPEAMPQQFEERPGHGDFYDHENDADLGLGGRRAVADWGADELFHGTPRRRRSSKALARERRLSGPAGPDASARAMEAASREAALRRHERDGATVTRIEEARSYAAPAHDTAVDAEAALAAVEDAAARGGIEDAAPLDLDLDHDPGFDLPVEAELAEPAGRRTVAITGRPEPLAKPRAMALERRRPQRTAVDRLGQSPDHVAGWAFGMGLLLIVIAVLSA
jgi:hypothetical protein